MDYVKEKPKNSVVSSIFKSLVILYTASEGSSVKQPYNYCFHVTEATRNDEIQVILGYIYVWHTHGQLKSLHFLLFLKFFIICCIMIEYQPMNEVGEINSPLYLHNIFVYFIFALDKIVCHAIFLVDQIYPILLYSQPLKKCSLFIIFHLDLHCQQLLLLTPQFKPP